MGTSVGTLSELQLCSPYLSSPGNYIVGCTDLTVREFLDTWEGNCIQPPLSPVMGGGERVRENEALLQTEMPFVSLY